MGAFKFQGRPRIFNTVEEFDNGVEEYFQEIDDQNEESMKKWGKLCRAPNIAGLCVYLGISKETFYNYVKLVDSNNRAFVDSVKRASQRLESYKLEKASIGQLKEITTIFDLKNNHGYADKQDVNINGNSETLSASDIREHIEQIKKQGRRNENK